MDATGYASVWPVLVLSLCCSIWTPANSAISNVEPRKSFARRNSFDPSSSKSRPTPDYLKTIDDIVEKCSHISSRGSIGVSSSNLPLTTVYLGRHHPALPSVRLIGNVDGNDVLSRDLLVQLLSNICERYGNDPLVTRLVDSTNIFILPSANPDSAFLSTSSDCPSIVLGNAQNVSLVNDFPDQYLDWHSYKTSQAQPETSALMLWAMAERFTLSAVFRSGFVAVTYPFFSPAPTSTIASVGDLNLFRDLASAYTSVHPYMSSGSSKCNSGRVPAGGIVQGAALQPESGNLPDFDYLAFGTVELQFYLYCCLDKVDSEALFRANIDSIFAFMSKARIGVSGRVVTTTGIPIDSVQIRLLGVTGNVTSNKDGYFHRLLVPGNYTLFFYKQGFESVHVSITVTDAVVVNVTLPLSIPFSIEEASALMSLLPSPTNMFYHNHNAILNFLDEMVVDCPDIFASYTLGKSVEGRELKVLVLSDQPNVHELAEPEVKLVANIHGDEVIGKECLIELVRVLCTSYNSVPSIKNLLDNIRLHVLLTANPDGMERAYSHPRMENVGRNNARDIDLNRDFPDQFNNQAHNPQPETRAIMDWIALVPFVLSGSFHGGAVVASYPFDGTKSGTTEYSRSPDDETFRMLASAYARAHASMSLGIPCLSRNKGMVDDDHFPDGITNGAAWYSLWGGMQDYNYLHSNTFELTLEVSCDKNPPSEQLPNYWEHNRAAIVHFISRALTGLRGRIQDKSGTPIRHAIIKVAGIEHDIVSAKDGDYWRLLVPGVHNISVSADGYLPEFRMVVVSDRLATQADFTLSPLLSVPPEMTTAILEPRTASPLVNQETPFNTPLSTSLDSGVSKASETTTSLTPAPVYYHSYQQLVDKLERFSSNSFVSVSSIGESALGRKILAMEINAYPDKVNPDLESIAFIGNIDGRDGASTEVLLLFLDHIIKTIESNTSDIMNILERTKIHIVPAANVDALGQLHPGDCDGSQVSGIKSFYNSFQWKKGVFPEDRPPSMQAEEPEVLAIKRWIVRHQFFMLFSLEAGFQGVRIPLSVATLPDAQVFSYLASNYEDLRHNLPLPSSCQQVSRLSSGFSDGTVIDYTHNAVHGTAVSVYLGCCRNPQTTSLHLLWAEHMPPLLLLTRFSVSRLRATVLDRSSSPVRTASLSIQPVGIVMNVPLTGSMVHFLPPRTYFVSAFADGYDNVTREVVISLDRTVSVQAKLELSSELVYHSYEELVGELQDLNRKHSSITWLSELGMSVGKRSVWVLELSDNPGLYEVGEPEVVLIGGVHGNELASTEVLLRFAKHLCTNYGFDDSITQLLNNTRVYIVPLLNPDGAALTNVSDCHSIEGELNLENMDLLTNYSVLGSSASSGKEAQLLSAWISRNSFALVGVLGSGDLSLSVPGASLDRDGGLLGPDRDVIDKLVSTYRKQHLLLSLEEPRCGKNISHRTYPRGTGLDSLAYFSYLSGSMSLHISVSCCHLPAKESLSVVYQQNQEPLKALLAQLKNGVHGVVTDAKTKTALSGVAVQVEGRTQVVRTTEVGHYVRLLTSGTHMVRFCLEGYAPQSYVVNVPSSRGVQLNVALQPQFQTDTEALRNMAVMLVSGVVVILALVVGFVVFRCRHSGTAGRKEKGYRWLKNSPAYMDDSIHVDARTRDRRLLPGDENDNFDSELDNSDDQEEEEVYFATRKIPRK